MRRLTFLTLALFMLLTFVCCNQTADDRYQQYLEEVADTSESSMEFITPKEDPVEIEEDDYDSWADDGGIVTVPEIPQERHVNMNANTYELEKVMMGKE